jgi:hypothetical protein
LMVDADKSCWLLGELVVQCDLAAGCYESCWLLGKLVIRYDLSAGC